MKKGLQYLSPEYVDQCAAMTIEQRAAWLEEYRTIMGLRYTAGKKLYEQLIDQDLLGRAQWQAHKQNVRLEEVIEKLLEEWLRRDGG